MGADSIMLGLGDWSVAAAFYLNIIGAAFCVIFASVSYTHLALPTILRV